MARALVLLACALFLAQAAAQKNTYFHANPDIRTYQGIPPLPGSGTGTTGTGGTGSGTTTPTGSRSPPSSGSRGGGGTSGGGGGGGGGQQVRVTDNLAVGAEDGTVTCASWDPSSESWEHTDNTEYGAKGGTKPPSQASKYASQICSDPQTAGEDFYKALGSGDNQEVLAWVYAMFVLAADQCTSETRDAYSVARTAVDDATKAATTVDEYLPVLAQFHKAIVSAGDALGIPMCVSVAIVDASDSSVIDETTLTTTG